MAFIWSTVRPDDGATSLEGVEEVGVVGLVSVTVIEEEGKETVPCVSYPETL